MTTMVIDSNAIYSVTTYKSCRLHVQRKWVLYAMEVDLPLQLLLGAVVANGILVGASLDQSIKQLPARRRIGIAAFSAYSRAADLANGRFWYGGLGAATALLTLSASIVGLADTPAPERQRTVALLSMASGTAAHSLVTARAAPTNYAQRHAAAAGDEHALARVFDRFERLQTIRATLQVATLASCVWALTVTIAGGSA
jgi:hypothetical protein